MRKVDGSEPVDLLIEYPFMEQDDETKTLVELGWNGQQGEELEEFMETVLREWVLDHVDFSIKFSGEDKMTLQKWLSRREESE